jgi:DNA-binding PadR family transcriptional regulator
VEAVGGVGLLTPLATMMLASLNERPMHCYEMYRLMLERHEDRVVKVKPGSLYHAMDRLVAHGLAEAVGIDREGGRPERTTYRITDAGRAAMSTWVREGLAEPVNEYPRFPVAIGEAHNLPRAEVGELLRRRIATLQCELDEAAALLEKAADRQALEVHLLDAHYMTEMTRAEIGWLSRLVTRVENEELAWPRQ